MPMTTRSPSKSSGEPIWPDVPVTAMSNITIENNSLYSARNNGITYGTDTYGPLSNYTIRNNFIRFAGKGAICLNAADGADVSDVLIENNYVADCGVPLFLRLNNRDRSGTGVGSMQDVVVRKLQAQYCRNGFGSSITGIPGHNIEGVILKDINILMRAGMTTIRARAGRIRDGRAEDEYLWGVAVLCPLFAAYRGRHAGKC